MLSCPSPYESQAADTRLAGNFAAGHHERAGGVVIDRIGVTDLITAISSTIRAVCGKSSRIQVPHSLACRKANFEGATGNRV